MKAHPANYCLAAALVVAGAGCATTDTGQKTPIAADATEGTFSLAPYEWEGRVSDGETVAISNPFGDLRVRSSIAGRVVVTGAIQRFAGDDRDIRVVVDDTRGELRIAVEEVDLPAGSAQPRTERGANGRFDGRIDMALLLPHSAVLEAETLDGLLELKSYTGPASLTTRAGRITALTPTAISARSESGAITVRFRATSWDRQARVSTRTGPIVIALPAAADLAVQARTRGELLAPPELPVTRTRDAMSARLGNATAQLSVRSDTGSIALQREPRR